VASLAVALGEAAMMYVAAVVLALVGIIMRRLIGAPDDVVALVYHLMGSLLLFDCGWRLWRTSRMESVRPSLESLGSRGADLSPRV
jgi:hypothetical protein